jgi:hypothetical protein
MVRQARLNYHVWTGEAGQRADAHGGTLAGLAQGLARTESQVARPTPPHPSHPQPFAGGHTAILKGRGLKYFVAKTKPENALSAQGITGLPCTMFALVLSEIYPIICVRTSLLSCRSNCLPPPTPSLLFLENTLPPSFKLSPSQIFLPYMFRA